MLELELQQYLLREYPQENARCEWKEFKNLKNSFKIQQALFMALAININDLLNKQKIESNCIEFKKGWNPWSIYHSICAFANDFDDLGGG